ncbi:MAG TPA: hypothetical protein VHB21_16145, partial [Minicystis sp.]|nr:hypothetical protein [Minicystis sp.]
PSAPVLLWNCPPYRTCAWPAFAAFAFPMKYQWLGRDHRYVCTDVAADPGEQVELPKARCGSLPELLRAHFGSPEVK